MSLPCVVNGLWSKILKKSPIIILIFLLTTITSCTTKHKWIKHSFAKNIDIHGVEIINDKTLMIYAYGTSELYKSSNSGETWLKSNSEVIQDIQLFPIKKM